MVKVDWISILLRTNGEWWMVKGDWISISLRTNGEWWMVKVDWILRMIKIDSRVTYNDYVYERSNVKHPEVNGRLTATETRYAHSNR
jgi:hypothetical protein